MRIASYLSSDGGNDYERDETSEEHGQWLTTKTWRTSVGNITVGTPDQQYIVIADTGSDILWVPGSDCDDLSELCDGKHKFESNLSSAFVKTNKKWSIQYPSGPANGVLGVDVFGGLNEEQLVVPNTTSGLASHMCSNFKQRHADGILGLAFNVRSVMHVVSPLINAINQGLLDQPFFTVWKQHLALRKEKPVGLFTYGAIDANNCGPIIAFEPMSFVAYYRFKVTRFYIKYFTILSLSNTKEFITVSNLLTLVLFFLANSDNVYIAFCDIFIATFVTHTWIYKAITDTGTSYVSGPKTVTDQLAKAAGSVFNSTEELYTIECNVTPPPLDITIGKNKYGIDLINYIFKVAENKCLLAIVLNEFGGFGPAWILGTPFIRQFCNIFDLGQKRIGFAPSLQK
uniref:Peptidase A1 domain-containing protein n=1 Tax=Angiostrongylus cantonensis TaxID=6313 RepID=A0A158P9Q8_ANGCA